MEYISEREELVSICRDLYVLGYASGSAGNLSVRLRDGNYLVTPSSSSFGYLKASDLSLVSSSFSLLEGKKPTKELFLHKACYEKNPEASAVIHLHSTFSTLIACLSDEERESMLRPITPYRVMKCPSIGMIPYFKPGDAALAEAVNDMPPHKDYLLKNHGMIVVGKDLHDALYRAQEFEESCKLAVFGRGMKLDYLSSLEIQELLK